jgi:hypothetical protein
MANIMASMSSQVQYKKSHTIGSVQRAEELTPTLEAFNSLFTISVKQSKGPNPKVRPLLLPIPELMAGGAENA